MYLGVNKLVKEDDTSVYITTEDENEPIVDEGVFVVKVEYDRKYSQDSVCDDAKKEVFDMTKNQSDFYEHLDSGGFF